MLKSGRFGLDPRAARVTWTIMVFRAALGLGYAVRQVHFLVALSLAAPDGPGERVIAVLTLAFAPVKRALRGVRPGPAGKAACRPPASRGQRAEGSSVSS